MRRKALTEAEWRRVFDLRCLSKRGTPATDEESRDLINRAYREDPDRYSAMNGDVFDATVPVGSNVRWKRGAP